MSTHGQSPVTAGYDQPSPASFAALSVVQGQTSVDHNSRVMATATGKSTALVMNSQQSTDKSVNSYLENNVNSYETVPNKLYPLNKSYV